jgi:hypothetical protein
MRLTLAAAAMVMSLFGVSESRHVCVTAMGRSAHAFSQYFQALQREPLNPLERVVFSLVLTHANTRQECPTPRHG